jgi:SAM-dependent methyltransferase
MRPALRPCPLCAGSTVESLHPMRFALAAGSSLPGAYDVVACAHCGFTYADTPGTREDYERHYAERSRYEDAAFATGAGQAPADRRRIDAVADWLAARVPPESDVLDIGCGAGGLLIALGARGFRKLAGIDPSPACVAQLRAHGLTAWQGTLARLPDEAAGCGLVILSHVLEHVLDVRAALGAVRARLGRGARLYIETPDASRYCSRPFVPFYFFDSEHINHFDGASLAALAARSGLEVIAAADDTIEVEGDMAYPVTRALLGLAAGAINAPARLDHLRDAVAAYVGESRRRTDHSALAALVAGGRPLALWGAGSQAQRLLADSPLAGVRFVAVLDRDRGKQGTSFAGCQVVAPEVALRGLPADTVVVIAAALAAQAIVAQCQAMGIASHVAADAG